ncbi:MAG: hypothetical protein ACU0AX_01930 [Roseovarius sp.]|uniref:hypothetical protein n=1 Tax=Roseovarius sp. TaxID=1486281 RepID=UPI0040592F0A
MKFFDPDLFREAALIDGNRIVRPGRLMRWHETVQDSTEDLARIQSTLTNSRLPRVD